MGIKPKSFVIISSASVAMFSDSFSELRVTAPGGIPAISVMVAVCELECRNIVMEVKKPKGGHETMGDGVGWVLQNISRRPSRRFISCRNSLPRSETIGFIPGASLSSPPRDQGSREKVDLRGLYPGKTCGRRQGQG